MPLQCCGCAEELDLFFSAPHRLVQLVLQATVQDQTNVSQVVPMELSKESGRKKAVCMSSPQGSMQRGSKLHAVVREAHARKTNTK